MRGVSAEGRTSSVQRLLEVAEDGDASVIGSELLAIANTLGREPALRRAMTDPSAAAEAKAGLARSIFEGKVSDSTLDVIATVAAARWSSTGDFADTVEELGVLAIVVDSEKSGHLSELEDELFRFGRVVLADPALRDAITNRQVAVERRQALVRELLDGKVSASAATLAGYAVASRHPSFEHALDAFQTIAADRQKRLVALVRTAVDLTVFQRERLTGALGAQYGQAVHLNVVVDPEVLGGIRVELGDDVIDGTVVARLADARRQMTG